jgi:hypothetical protein
MNSSKLSDWLQVIGLFSVLAGLLFVGLQLRQEQELAQAARIQTALDSERAWGELIIDNAELWTKGLAGEPLSATETVQFRVMVRLRDYSWYAFWNSSELTGRSEVETDSVVLEAAIELSSNPGLLKFWREHIELHEMYGRSSDWAELVEAEVARVEAQRSAGR